jgi:hypothetical protein
MRLRRRQITMLSKVFKKHSAGQSVPGGVYLKSKAWELVSIPEEGGRLPEGEEITFYRVPVMLVLALGPAAGLAFILFVPLLVPLLTLYAAGKVIARNLPSRSRQEVPVIR